MFPIRDPKNSMDTHKALTDYVKTLRNSKEPNWVPDNALIESVKDITKKGVFICGHLKSGTSLLLELLDGHPELIVMPGDSRMRFWIMRYWNSRHSNKIWTEYLKDWSLYWVSRLVNPTGQKPFWIIGENDKPYLNFLHYRDYWLKCLPPSHTSPFLATVLAFYCANPRRAPNPKLWVEKKTGNEMHIDMILNDFPLARFIHIVRDPLSNIASLKKRSKLRKTKWDAIMYISRIKTSINAGFINQERLGEDRYHILRYEDLVTTPETEMKKIAHFLGIIMDESLLFPTVNGFPAKSNTMFKDRKIQGKILSTLSDNWRVDLDSFEQKTMMAILYPEVKRLGYKWNTFSSNWTYSMHYYQARFRHYISRILRRVRNYITKDI